MAVAKPVRMLFTAQARAPEWATVTDRTESEMVGDRMTWKDATVPALGPG